MTSLPSSYVPVYPSPCTLPSPFTCSRPHGPMLPCVLSLIFFGLLPSSCLHPFVADNSSWYISHLRLPPPLARKAIKSAGVLLASWAGGVRGLPNEGLSLPPRPRCTRHSDYSEAHPHSPTPSSNTVVVVEPLRVHAPHPRRLLSSSRVPSRSARLWRRQHVRQETGEVFAKLIHEPAARPSRSSRGKRSGTSLSTPSHTEG